MDLMKYWPSIIIGHNHSEWASSTNLSEVGPIWLRIELKSRRCSWDSRYNSWSEILIETKTLRSWVRSDKTSFEILIKSLVYNFLMVFLCRGQNWDQIQTKNSYLSSWVLTWASLKSTVESRLVKNRCLLLAFEFEFRLMSITRFEI